ncbi:MAG: sulfite exporter TauE/SafE family protein [Candidatus Eisenbacteria bacterium]
MTAILIGLAGGLASGLLGIGGGVVLVPLLGKFLHLDQKRAQATSLAILVFTALAAALTYGAMGTVDLRLAALLALGAVFGVRLGALLSNRLSSATLRRAFGVFAFLVGVRLLLEHLPEGRWLAQPGIAGMALEVAVGFVVGWLGGLLGVGGGIILVPILTLLFGVPQHEAQGVSLFMIVPMSIVGAWTQLRLGAVEKPLVAPIAAAAVVAAIAAAALANELPAPLLRRLFGLLLVVMGARMALRPVAAGR